MRFLQESAKICLFRDILMFMSLPYCENKNLIHIDPPYLYIYADLSNFVLKHHPLQPTIASKSVVPNHRLYLLISIIHSSCWRRLVTFSRSLTPLHEKKHIGIKGTVSQDDILQKESRRNWLVFHRNVLYH